MTMSVEQSLRHRGAAKSFIQERLGRLVEKVGNSAAAPRNLGKLTIVHIPAAPGKSSQQPFREGADRETG
jgi:hypothetical protein